MFLEISQNPQKNICVRVSFSIWMQEACNFIKKETLAQVFSCKFWEISKNNFLHCFIFFHLAFNAKSFSVGFLVFFSFCPSRHISGRTAKSFSVIVLYNKLSRKCVTKIWLIPWTLNSLFVKIVPQVIIGGARGT